MTDFAQLGDLDLASLISSRICHDAIGPVGAIANGLEVLDDNPDESMRNFALDSIRKSASSASFKLQFARMAYGAAGSAGTRIDMRDARAVAEGFVGTGKHGLDWHCDFLVLDKDKVKLLLNMVALAVPALPRGGNITVTVGGSEDDPEFDIVCEGNRARVADGIVGLLAGNTGQELDSRSIQPYYAGRVARSATMSLTMEQTADNRIVLRASRG